MKQPLFIKHRVNRIAELDLMERQWGAEIDLRSDVSRPGKIHLSHDPWSLGDDFEAWLAHYRDLKLQGPVILNTKEDGLEKLVIDLMIRFEIENYFFLDTTVPTLVKWALKSGEPRFAVRISSQEPTELALKFAGKTNWLWVDCFDGVPLSVSDLSSLREKFKICLVSPELQAQPIEAIGRFKRLFEISDAVCTKDPQAWISRYGA